MNLVPFNHVLLSLSNVSSEFHDII